MQNSSQTKSVKNITSVLATSCLILMLGACAADPEPAPTPTTDEMTATPETTPSQTPSDEQVDYVETSSQGGTFTFQVPEGWTLETIEYETQDVELTGVPYETFNITSPLGDISIQGAVHGGPTSGDGWRSQHWQVADIEELDLPVHSNRERVYLRTDLEWLGEDDADIDTTAMGWESGEYRLVTNIVSQNGELSVGDDDENARLDGWAYWSPVSDPYQGETSFITVLFTQELMEELTGETGREAVVEAFLENEWYHTTTDILRSMEYTEPAAEDLPIQ